MQPDHFHNHQHNLPRAALISIESNALTSIYGKLQYTLMSFLMKHVCRVFEYIWNDVTVLNEIVWTSHVIDDNKWFISQEVQLLTFWLKIEAKDVHSKTSHML